MPPPPGCGGMPRAIPATFQNGGSPPFLKCGRHAAPTVLRRHAARHPRHFSKWRIPAIFEMRGACRPPAGRGGMPPAIPATFEMRGACRPPAGRGGMPPAIPATFQMRGACRPPAGRGGMPPAIPANFQMRGACRPHWAHVKNGGVGGPPGSSDQRTVQCRCAALPTVPLQAARRCG